MLIFWRVLIINQCWILSKTFSTSIEIILWFLSFSLLIWCNTLIDLHILKISCIPGINPTWSWCMNFLICCLGWSWASLVAERVKHLPAMQDARVHSLGWKDLLEKEMQPSPVFLPWESHGRRSLVGYSPWDRKESDTTGDFNFTFREVITFSG